MLVSKSGLSLQTEVDDFGVFSQRPDMVNALCKLEPSSVVSVVAHSSEFHAP